jgi:hypothetical protein
MANPFPDIFPDGPDGWQPDLGDEIGEAIDISVNGIVQINVFDFVEIFRAKASWKVAGPSDRDSIRTHYLANRSSNTGFSLFDFFVLPYTALACGTGNGSNKTFTIPGKATAGHVVYDNGGVVSASNYAISVGTGADGEDQIVYTVGATAPANGHLITCDVTAARKRFKVLYVTRKWSLRWSGEGDIWVIELEFIEKVN